VRRLLIGLLFSVALPAQAQMFDLGRALDLGKKALDTGKKLQEANRDYTSEEEVALGEGITAGFLGAAPLHSSAPLQRYVNRLGRWLALQTERPDLPWTFGVLDTDTINAFAMPGGTVLVSHGLVKRLQNESELAGVLAHEIAHVVKRHQLQAIQSGAGTDALAGIGKELAAQRIARSSGGDVLGLKGQLAGAGVDLVKNGFFVKPLDRWMEYEADRLGVVIAARAGYDPYGLVAVLSMLSTVKPEESGVSLLFTTHPGPGERIAELEKFMPNVLDRYSNLPTVEGRFRQAVSGR
jgi:beta-barrel assembly-enhancing protease